MFNPKNEVQPSYEVVLLEDLVPQDHLLRKINALLDTSFIREKTKPFYSDKGRPALDPVVLVKMELIAYLFGIRSDRRLVEEIRVNVAYRWFLGLNLTDPVPHFTTPGKNYTRRWKDSGVFEELFDHVVLQAVNAGYIDGRALFTDSSHLKANANKRYIARAGTKGVTEEMIAEARERHLAARQAEREMCDDAEDDIFETVNANRIAHGLKPLPAPTTAAEAEQDPTDVKVTASVTDPEAAMLRREGKPDGFHYLQHRTVEGKHNFVVDVLVTSAALTDARVYPVCLKRVEGRFTFAVKQVGLDAGYNTTQILSMLRERGIQAAIAHRRFAAPEGLMGKWRFTYIPTEDAYLCPAKQRLTYATTTRDGYMVYRSDASVCSQCPLLSECTRSAKHQKVIQRHVHEDLRDDVRAFLKTEEGQYLAQRRRETVERSFADSKELHGLRYARYRGRKRVQHQCLMSALAQNLKKLALLECQRVPRTSAA